MNRKLLALVPMAALAFIALPSMTGCETLTETAGQNANKIHRVVYIDLMQLPDDAEEILLVDRPSWLSRKPMPSY